MSIDDTAQHIVKRRRLVRSAIRPLDMHTMAYRELFNDTNGVQLESAIRNGIHDPSSFVCPEESDELTCITSNDLYWIDTMRYSLPLLVPEAKLLLHQIGCRFQEVMAEDYPDAPHYRLVVTSCFRTQNQVNLLRYHNRNATENSCHCYGTTMDISHIRFLNDNGEMVNELFLKQMLAKALFELRYEGLCWVKYEQRQSCFHITLRATEYQGNLASTTERYSEPSAASFRKYSKQPKVKSPQKKSAQLSSSKLDEPTINYISL
ncbi:MAG: DUF5715 family protein [Bacteroidales bacterium]|nr:DUF5715 family protein [Bacteroidales bacterium]